MSTPQAQRGRGRPTGGRAADRTHGLLRRLAGLVLVLLPLAAPLPARAEALDELTMQADNADAVVRLKFNVRMHYLRHAPLGSTDLMEIYFQLLGGDEMLTRPIEENLELAPQGRVPGVSVTYPVQPGVTIKRIVVHFTRKVAVRVRPGPNNQVLDLVLPGLASSVPPPSAAPAVDHDRYAITLQSVPLAERDQLRPVPGRFQDYVAFNSRAVHNGVDLVELDLGYFDNATAAEQVRQSALRDFPDAVVFDVIARKQQSLQQASAQGRKAPVATPVPLPAPAASPAAAPEGAGAAAGLGSAGATAASAVTAPVPAQEPAASTNPGASAPAATPGAAPASPAATPAAGTTAPAPAAPTIETDLDQQAAGLMAKARAALAGGQNEQAIAALNQVLLLPPNKYSQDAQELVGLARERSGAFELARKEYELYLKLFPTGDGATRVRQRLAAMSPPVVAAGPVAEVGNQPKPGAATAPKWSYSGGISQYYYGGDQKVVSAFVNVPTIAGQQTLTSTTQSSLITALDVSGRYRDEANDVRAVVRGTDQYSLISTVPSLFRADSAYVDYRSLSQGFSVRAGRLSGATGGLLGRFDGVSANYDLNPHWRFNVVGGAPVDGFVQTKQRFESASVEASNLYNHWGGSAFLVNQTADGVVDRRAVGGELRYFNSHASLYSLADYDLNFHQLNSTTLQGTYQLEDQTSFSLLADRRKAPPLQTSNALIQIGCSTISQALSVGCPQPLTLTDSQGNVILTVHPANTPYTIAELRQQALLTTAESTQYSLGVTRPLTRSWQVGASASLTSVGALPTVEFNGQTVPGSSATGNVKTFGLQATGSNLYSHRDVNVFTLNHLAGPEYSGTQFNYSNLTGFYHNRATIEPSIGFYREDDKTGQHTTRYSPGLRFTLKVLPRLSVESDVTFEHTKVTGTSQNDTTSNTFYYLGYRYDLP